MPIPEPASHKFILVVGPGGSYDERLTTRIESLFGCRLTFVSDFDGAAGAIYLGEDGIVPDHCAKVLDFFYARDGREANVYRYRPVEKEFYIIPKSWLDRRRES